MNTQEVARFLTLYKKEFNLPDEWFRARMGEVEACEIFDPTTEELTFAARVAWRNSNKCIGRLFWQSLHVIDAREKLQEQEIYEALCHHIHVATNNGKIRPVITVFAAGRVRIWNHQLIRYAGYETAEGIVGDAESLAFTKICEELGWQGAGTHYDVLPLVVQVDDHALQWFDIPRDLVLEVPITHPEYDLAELAMRWYAVPIISSMRLDCGGINFEASPFNGWYMGTEIGARNLADTHRYNYLPDVARKIGLDTTKNATLWRDRALVELNVAVLHSYKEVGVSIVDHHTAAQQFKLFQQQEQAAGRAVTGNWVWLIPPLSPATTHVYHEPIDNTIHKPNYFYQQQPH